MLPASLEDVPVFPQLFKCVLSSGSSSSCGMSLMKSVPDLSEKRFDLMLPFHVGVACC